MKSYDAVSAGWQMAKAALELFRPDGRLNDRAWAERGSAKRCPRWRARRGRRYGTCSSHPRPSRSWTSFMRNLAGCRSIRNCARRWCGSGGSAGARKDDDGHHAKAILLQEVLCWQLAPDWQRWYPKAVETLRTTVRASSVVESVNSVLRMHQSRHRNLGQGLLDLKRLYWNTRSIVRKAGVETLPLPIAGARPVELRLLDDPPGRISPRVDARGYRSGMPDLALLNVKCQTDFASIWDDALQWPPQLGLAKRPRCEEPDPSGRDSKGS